MAHTLEDGRVPQGAKNGLAYQLAAIGMSGAPGTGVTKPLASNAYVVTQQLGQSADAQKQATACDWKAMFHSPIGPLALIGSKAK